MVNGLGQVAQTLRHTATLVDNFSSSLQQLSFPPAANAQSFPAQMLQSLASMLGTGQMPPAPSSSGSSSNSLQNNIAMNAIAAQNRPGHTTNGKPAVVDDDSKKRKRPEATAAGEKKVKKVKDPNAPKRPASAYLIFQNQVREEFKKKHPELPNNGLLSEIAKVWASMSSSDKQVRIALHCVFYDNLIFHINSLF